MEINGSHAVIEALKKDATGTVYIHSQQKYYKLITSLAKKNHCKIEIVSPQELKSKLARQGVLFKITSVPDTYVPNLKQWLSERKEVPLGIIVLDHILDPQNLGAIMRSAVLFDIDLMVLPQRRNAPENEVAARSSAGGFATMNRCYENNLQSVVKLLQEHNIWVYAMDMKGTDMSMTKIPQRSAFILGNEHKGVSRILQEKCDERLSIPHNNKLDSLNVSVSAAIVSYEYYKVRNFVKSSKESK